MTSVQRLTDHSVEALLSSRPRLATTPLIHSACSLTDSTSGHVTHSDVTTFTSRSPCDCKETQHRDDDEEEIDAEWYSRSGQQAEQHLTTDINSSHLADDSPPGVELRLENSELWSIFHALCTEMVITKSGRRMFPALKLLISGLDSSRHYVILMDIIPVDNYRYKYQDSRWVVAGKADHCLLSTAAGRPVFIHPDSPAPGQHWTSHAVSFHKLKLTNSSTNKYGHIILNSMHRYQPRFYVIESRDVNNLANCPLRMFTFPETQFIAVTAYQNDKITQLKIDNNPFAKGFRATGAAKSADKKRTTKLSRDMSPDVTSHSSAGSSAGDVRQVGDDVTDSDESDSAAKESTSFLPAINDCHTCTHNSSVSQSELTSQRADMTPYYMTLIASIYKQQQLSTKSRDIFRPITADNNKLPVRFSPYVITNDVTPYFRSNVTSS